MFGFCPVFFHEWTLFNKAMGAPNDDQILYVSDLFWLFADFACFA